MFSHTLYDKLLKLILIYHTFIIITKTNAHTQALYLYVLTACTSLYMEMSIQFTLVPLDILNIYTVLSITRQTRDYSSESFYVSLLSQLEEGLFTYCPYEYKYNYNDSIDP